MRNFFIVIAAFLFFSLQACKQEISLQQDAVKDGVFIHISHGSDDLHRVLMGLQMAVKMSEDKDVLVYFDISGIDVVLKDSEDLTYSHFPSTHTQLKNMFDNDVTVMACPGCLKTAGKTEDDLMEGVKLADKDKFFNFTKGRILTLDY